MSDAKKTSKNVSAQALEFLRAKGKKARKAGQATTQEIADAIGVPMKQVYDRLWWMEKKEGLLVSQGTGKNRTWRTTPKPRPAAKPKAAKSPPVVTLPTASEEE
jgi:hypothetical protein